MAKIIEAPYGTLGEQSPFGNWKLLSPDESEWVKPRPQPDSAEVAAEQSQITESEGDPPDEESAK
jgi:hypothetical protein